MNYQNTQTYKALQDILTTCKPDANGYIDDIFELEPEPKKLLRSFIDRCDGDPATVYEAIDLLVDAIDGMPDDASIDALDNEIIDAADGMDDGRYSTIYEWLERDFANIEAANNALKNVGLNDIFTAAAIARIDVARACGELVIHKIEQEIKDE